MSLPFKSVFRHFISYCSTVCWNEEYCTTEICWQNCSDLYHFISLRGLGVERFVQMTTIRYFFFSKSYLKTWLREKENRSIIVTINAILVIY